VTIRSTSQAKSMSTCEGGSVLVIVIDPTLRAMTLYDTASEGSCAAGDTLRHAGLPALELPLARFFAMALDLPT